MTSYIMGALAGLRVIDLSRVLGGPYCTQALGDHGAEILKIEPPQGDETRGWGPPFRDGLSAYFSGANRNKKALALDLSLSKGRDVLLRLLEEADILVHNFKSGTMERWGLGYDDVLQARFPRLVYCHISGFGDTGPLGGLPGYDAVVQAMTGLMSINGQPENGPVRMGMPIVDIGTGLIATVAILAAVVERDRSGRGQKIDVPLYDCAISMLHPQAANALMTGKVPVATGNAHPNISPYDMYPTQTMPLYLAVGNNGQFAKLCVLLDMPETVNDPRFASNADRIENRAALTALLSERLATMDAHALERKLITAGVPAGAVRTVTEALEHPHTAYREMVVERDGYRGTGIPAKLGRTPGSVRGAPPRFGADTREILALAGYDEASIAGLLNDGVVLADDRSSNGKLTKHVAEPGHAST